MEKLLKCPICAHEGTQKKYSLTDYSVSQEIFEIQKCSGCGFLFTNPRPSKSEIFKYYQSENYISHSATRKGILNKIYHLARWYMLRKKINLLSAYSNQGSLLDIGCGTGHFLLAAKKAGWKVTGIEPDRGARDLAKNITQDEILDEDALIQICESKKFDVITMWHVLEHVHDLTTRIEQVKKMMSSNSVLFVAVPNHHAYDALYYGQFWGAYDVPRHLYHFTSEDIILLFEKHGFILSDILPMKLDAYYVSMLSEKYKKGFALRGVLNGLISNIRASKENNKYSSQIYVLKLKSSDKTAQ